MKTKKLKNWGPPPSRPQTKQREFRDGRELRGLEKVLIDCAGFLEGFGRIYIHTPGIIKGDVVYGFLLFRALEKDISSLRKAVGKIEKMAGAGGRVELYRSWEQDDYWCLEIIPDIVEKKRDELIRNTSHVAGYLKGVLKGIYGS